VPRKQNLANQIVPRRKFPKLVFVSGGVLSGLGKGITTASVSLLLKSRGYKVTTIKCDMYLNIDAGTMNPVEHGEVFVTDDRAETDQDIGHYERFLNEDLPGKNYITAGQVYYDVLQKERRLEYGGKTIDAYEEIPEEIIRRIKKSAQGYEIAVIELGGTVGEYQNIMFFEAIRRLKIKDPSSTLLIHVGYLPIPQTLGEPKSKPIQQSIQELNSLGLRPDFVVARSEKPIDLKRKEKIAFSAAIDPQDVISNPDVNPVYRVPLVLEEQDLTRKILQRFGLRSRGRKLGDWKNLIKRIEAARKPVRIGMVTKYISSGDFTLEDSYICVNEAIKHAAWEQGLDPQLVWIDSEKLEEMGKEEFAETLAGMDGMIVPQGWGSRGTEGKIKAIQFAREHKVPYLGLCFGMQMAVIEFSRHVLGLKDAHTAEADPKTKNPVIHVMPNQQKYLQNRQYGGTIRLGAWKCGIAPRTLLRRIYGRRTVSERHRHRYELNNKYRQLLEKNGMKLSGLSSDKELVEAVELDQKLHPFFLGVQFHPELKSRPLSPHPIFREFMRAASGDGGRDRPQKRGRRKAD